MENEVVMAKEEQEGDLDFLKIRVLKFLKVHFPKGLFWVEVKNGNPEGYVIEIRTDLVKTTEKTRKRVLCLEEKFGEEGLTLEEFEVLLYLKRMLKRDEMVKQEIRRLFLHNRLLGQENVENFVIEGFEAISLVSTSDSDSDSDEF
jgi:hypothetical protein